MSWWISRPGQTLIAHENFVTGISSSTLQSGSQEMFGNSRNGRRSIISGMTKWSIITRMKKLSAPLQDRRGIIAAVCAERFDPTPRTRPAGSVTMQTCARRRSRGVTSSYPCLLHDYPDPEQRYGG